MQHQALLQHIVSVEAQTVLLGRKMKREKPLCFPMLLARHSIVACGYRKTIDHQNHTNSNLTYILHVMTIHTVAPTDVLARKYKAPRVKYTLDR